MLTQTTPFRRIRTAGRVQGAGRSLSIRRTWYAGTSDPALDAKAGDKKDGDAGDKGDEGSDDDSDEDDDALAKLTPKELAEIVRKERRDAANYRTKLRAEEANAKKLQDEKTKADREAAAASAKKLEEQGEYKTLYEQQQQSLKALEEKAKRADEFEQKLNTKNEERIKAIPESHAKLLPKGYTPAALEEWLDANEPLWKKPTPPNFDPGKKGERKPADKSVLKPMKW